MFPAGKYRATTKEEPSDAVALPTPSFWVLFHTIAVKWPGLWWNKTKKEKENGHCWSWVHTDRLAVQNICFPLFLLNFEVSLHESVWITVSRSSEWFTNAWLNEAECEAMGNHLEELGQTGNDLWAKTWCERTVISPNFSESDSHTPAEVWHERSGDNNLASAWLNVTRRQRKWQQIKWEWQKETDQGGNKLEAVRHEEEEKWVDRKYEKGKKDERFKLKSLA